MTLNVSRTKVKTIKDALEAHNLLDKSIKITPRSQGECFSIPLKAPNSTKSQEENDPTKTTLLQLLSSIGMERYIADVTLCVGVPLACDESTEKGSLSSSLAHGTASLARRNPLEAAIDAWLKTIPAFTSTKPAYGNGETSLDTHRETDPPNKISGYTVYPPMLLLPPTALLDYLLDDQISKHLPRLYESLCQVLRVTHIALNAPIPTSAYVEDFSGSRSDGLLDASPNVLRSPTGLTPLYGDFGRSLPAGHIPTASDFESAFWCTTRQNGIFQTWAPRYTMFSRGNISEKARILDLALSDGQPSPGNTHSSYKTRDSTAVDLYAGIGYFAFSYAKAGMAKVLCWEINPWSVEGLRRGAKGNKWGTMILRKDDGDEKMLQRLVAEDRAKFIVFQESNENATSRIKAILSDWRSPFALCLDPIRHVNCGYLPSSIDSWRTAVQVLDEVKGGWIHAHENIGKSDIDARRVEIIKIFRDLATEKHGPVYDANALGFRRVSCDHLERVKSYAPGIIHCVLDIAIINYSKSPAKA